MIRFDKSTGRQVLLVIDSGQQDLEGVTLSGTSVVSVEITDHGAVTGDEAIFADAAGCTELNGNRYTITRTDDDNFTLDSTNSSNFTAWTSGGTALLYDVGLLKQESSSLATPGDGAMHPVIDNQLYRLDLSSADTDTVGAVLAAITVRGATPSYVFAQYEIREATEADVLSDTVAIQTVTDKLDDTLENDGGTYRFTENALEEGPGGSGGDATEAKQDIIIAAQTAIKGSGFATGTDSLAVIASAVGEATGARFAPDASSTITTGTADANTYTACLSNDGTKWTIGDSNAAGSTLEVICEFNMGESRLAAELNVNGYFDRNSAPSSTKVLVYAYNYTTSSWDNLSQGDADTELRNRAGDKNYLWPLSNVHTDVDTVPGEVKIKFESTRETTQGNDVLYLDWVSIVGNSAAAVSPQAVALAVHEELDEHLKYIRCNPGDIHYVDGSNGDDNNNGHSLEQAYATIAAGIASSTTGDMVIVRSGTYSESGLELSVDGVKLVGEPGVIISTTSGTESFLISGDNCIVEDVVFVQNSSRIGVKVTGDICTLRRIRMDTNLSVAYDIQGAKAELVECLCANVTTAGFKFTGGLIQVENCRTVGTGATIGFWVASGNYGHIVQGITTGHTTAGFQIDSGVTGVAVIDCSSSPGDGDFIDNGTSTAIRQYHDVEVEAANTTLIEGLDATTQLETAAAAGGDATAATQTTILSNLATVDTVVGSLVAGQTAIKGATFDTATDSLEAIRDRGDAAWITGGAGTGAVEIVYNVSIPEETGTPVASVLVQVSTDSLGANIQWTQLTDAFGNASFNLDPGTYYFWRYKPGYTFTNPDTETIS